ncbi:DUF2071 domain-containing protein [Nocardia sp. NPDC052566]|uniref:DUF2071 domain-containing protein n=1 Tax=Nocardia sp. NPDC052566 TaxID=3364330 RepID=UPI0037C98FB5
MIPTLASVIERRLLVNYRVDPAVAAGLLPAPLRPQLVGDWAVAGICLIRLGQVRPPYLPSGIGVRSENAAHRIAVEWDGPDGVRTGVYIPRRDTDSRLNTVVGGRLFPGVHHLADFDVRETGTDLHVEYATMDGSTRVAVDARLADDFAGSRLFPDLATASEFFRQGCGGYSCSADPRRLDGVELATDAWRVEPVELIAVHSSFFEDPARFPPGSATLDCALVMRDVPARWRTVESMRLSVPEPLGL